MEHYASFEGFLQKIMERQHSGSFGSYCTDREIRVLNIQVEMSTFFQIPKPSAIK